MGTLAFFYFVIILFIILNGFNDTNGHGRCGCRHKRLPRECRSKKPMQGVDKNKTDVKANCHQVKVENDKCTTAIPKRKTIAGSSAMHSELICVSAYDVLLLTANFNQLIVDAHNIEKNVADKDSKSSKEINFNPIFDMENVDGCFKLKLNTDYANIFGEPVQGFLTNDLIDGINPLVERDEKTKSCPNENDANMLIAINLCAVGKSFSDQLSNAQNITDKILQNSMKQLSSLKAKLSLKYDALYKILVANRYEKQLKNAIILKTIASGGLIIKLCENESTTTTTTKEPRRRGFGAQRFRGANHPELQTTSWIPIPVLEGDKTETWNEYVKDFGRNFETFKDVINSADYFRDSKRDINKHNMEYKEGKSSFYMKYTKFSDQKTWPLGKRRGHSKTNNSARGIPTTRGGDIPPLPRSFDWRKFGAVTSVVDQGEKCGSCYSFSTVPCLEFLHFKKTRKLETLSKQQYIDCTGDYDCYGCNSGFTEGVFNYLINGKHGCELESNYPYTAKEGKKCKYNKKSTVLSIGGWKYASCDFYETCPQNDEYSMQIALTFNGPISVCVYASCNKFKNYGGGVYDDKCCNGKTSADTDHAMAIVGYDTDPVHGDYWILKNSYGTEWGENGYMRMKRGINQCGVASTASYPTI